LNKFIRHILFWYFKRNVIYSTAHTHTNTRTKLVHHTDRPTGNSTILIAGQDLEKGGGGGARTVGKFPCFAKTAYVSDKQEMSFLKFDIQRTVHRDIFL